MVKVRSVDIFGMLTFRWLAAVRLIGIGSVVATLLTNAYCWHHDGTEPVTYIHWMVSEVLNALQIPSVQSSLRRDSFHAINDAFPFPDNHRLRTVTTCEKLSCVMGAFRYCYGSPGATSRRSGMGEGPQARVWSHGLPQVADVMQKRIRMESCSFAGNFQRLACLIVPACVVCGE